MNRAYEVCFWYSETDHNRRLTRSGVRVVEGARLEIVYRATYREFESLSLRHFCFCHHFLRIDGVI